MASETSSAVGECRVDATVGAYSAEFIWLVPPFGPMPVRIERDDDGSMLATDLITDSYGVGLTVGEALDALSAAIRRHYEFLRVEGQEQLSERLATQLNILERRRADVAGAVSSDVLGKLLWAQTISLSAA